MTTLKDLTWDAHQRAERTQLMGLILNNTISDPLYCDLVYTKYQIYSCIENRIKFDTPDLNRSVRALNDWQQMACHLPRVIDSLEMYLDHLRTITVYQLWGHVYVHYLAPLYGGKIIRARIQHRFPTSMYEFDDPTQAIAEVRQHVTVELAPEANHAFESTITYYDQLVSQHLIT